LKSASEVARKRKSGVTQTPKESPGKLRRRTLAALTAAAMTLRKKKRERRQGKV
jgi:hypothetical protein